MERPAAPQRKIKRRSQRRWRRTRRPRFSDSARSWGPSLRNFFRASHKTSVVAAAGVACSLLSKTFFDLPSRPGLGGVQCFASLLPTRPRRRASRALRKRTALYTETCRRRESCLRSAAPLCLSLPFGRFTPNSILLIGSNQFVARTMKSKGVFRQVLLGVAARGE